MSDEAIDPCSVARIEAIVRKLEFLGLITRKELRGCSNHEIMQIVSSQETEAPSTYRAFMRVMGKHAGRFLSGSDFLFPKACSLRESAIELLMQHNHASLLPNKALVFLMHQGYCFWYFDPDTNDLPASFRDNPPVRYYVEGAKETCLVANTFRDFLYREMFTQAGLQAATLASRADKRT